MRHKNVIGYLTIALTYACVSPYNVTTEFHPAIVIQGLITDQPGPYLVTVYNSMPVIQQAQVTSTVSGATVIIKDDAGNSETLKEQSEGQYYTSSMQGVIGRTYTISVTTSEGYIYESTPEKMISVGDFTNITTVFVQNEGRDANEQVTSTNGFNVFIDSEVLPEQEQRVWWRWNGTFHFFTFPKQRKIINICGPFLDTIIFHRPPPCSGYTVTPFPPSTLAGCAAGQNYLVGPIGPCTCCDCWYTRYNQTPLISDPRFITNGSINHFNVAFVEVNRRTFYDKYYLEIEQLSPSQAVYEFWKSVQGQKSNSSNLFQTPPPKAVGNLSATSKDALPVMGYFAASASVKHAITLDKGNLPTGYVIMQLDSIDDSCYNVYANATNVKPAFW